MVRKISSIQSPFITKILNELTTLRTQVEQLSVRVQQLEGVDSKVGEEGREEYMEEAKIKAASTITMIGMARRAIFGYSMLLKEMGLPKEQQELVRQVEQSITAIMRLVQTIKILELAMAPTTGKVGMIMYLAMAGGTAAATLLYGDRALGG